MLHSILRNVIFLYLGLFAFNAKAVDQDQSAENWFQQGYLAYEEDDYQSAIDALKKATELDPNQSEYFHILGKSYGKLASESNWFKAIDLSQMTLLALERAVELDPKNRQAKIDLIKFYRQAPGFLGGDDKKADELEKQLESTAEAEETSQEIP